MIQSLDKIVLNNSVQTSLPCKKQGSEVFVRKTVDSVFAQNVIEQFGNLTRLFGDRGVDKLIILESPDDIKDFANACPSLSRKLSGEGSIAYGVYDRKDKAICIVQNNHARKDKKLEGNVSEQGSDTITHEFGHLIDKGFSSSEEFKASYKKDLENFEKHLKENPFGHVGDSDMTYAQAKDYFKHYFEGADFSNGIDDSDVTRQGLREQWAECFSIAHDSSENKANNIHKTIFGNSYSSLCKILA